MIEDPNELINNIWLIDWQNDLDESKEKKEKTLIEIGEGRSLFVNQITLEKFDDLFSALGEQVPIERVNVKVWRNLTRTVHDIVRDRNSQLKVNIATLNHFAQQENMLNVLSITDFNPEALGAIYVFTISDIAKEWGEMHYHPALKAIEDLKRLTGFDIRNSQNHYHMDLNKESGRNAIRRYSASAVKLLTDIHYGNETKFISPIDETELTIKQSKQATLDEVIINN